MDSVHCFRCFRFPSKQLDFYISSCMHIFCVNCKNQCDLNGGDRGENAEKSVGGPKCLECELQPCRLVKMGPNMPNQVRLMFSPLREDFQNFQKELSRVITFQARQRNNLVGGLSKKTRLFEKLREAYNEEKTKKEQYKKQLEHAYRIIQSKEQEIMDLKQKLREEAPPTLRPAPLEEKRTPSMIKVFSDSMYRTPDEEKRRRGKMEIPEFLKYKSKTVQAETKDQQMPPRSDGFQTPCLPPKTSMGFTTPANPPHMFPHLQKLDKPKQHSQ